ncbi:Aste57867_10339 [Aphanomyces stellatus]|uniref:Aste57867_10339 protein n=1 Tax=Aphanomyces stellatus TaxID=120398 RepID=A0A485KR40_9STRA|nr:hypothetical protein As57867_010299 [Aphanomyces stellatus]VFT87213.1 Aste57867_10339 [Aphanomyces stellatus]
MNQVLRGDAAERVAVFLTLRDLLRLEATAKDLVTKDLWGFLHEQFKQSVANNTNADNPESMPFWHMVDEAAIEPKAAYLNLLMNQKTSMVGRDTSIVHFASDGPYWRPQDGQGEFGRYAYLRTVCWGEWWSHRQLPPSAYDVVIRMKWTSSDFDRVNPMTFDVTGDEGLPLLAFAVTAADKKNWSVSRGDWINFNIGTISLHAKQQVTVHYSGNCSFWYGDWYVDWVGFFPTDVVPRGVSLARTQAT